MNVPVGWRLVLAHGGRVGVLEHELTGYRFSMTAQCTPLGVPLATISQERVDSMAAYLDSKFPNGAPFKHYND